VKKGGIVSIVGVYGPIQTLVPIGNVVNKGITIRANQASVKRLLPRLIEHVQNGVLDPKPLLRTAFRWNMCRMATAFSRPSSITASSRCCCRHQRAVKSARSQAKS
jgi:threonine dehydrogenase-like Zn-dependent dehydrogenase